MAAPIPAEFTVLGFSLKDIFGLMIIPIIAALTTLIVQRRQQARDRKLTILRTITATRAVPADASYVASINLIPIEFNGSRKVMEAWSAYIQQVSRGVVPGDERRHQERNAQCQTKLISAMMADLGLKFSEADIQADAYVSMGFVERELLYLDSLRAQREIAEALKAD